MSRNTQLFDTYLFQDNTEHYKTQKINNKRVPQQNQ